MPDDLSPTDTRIRETVRAAIERRNPRLTQLELAQKIGVRQPNVAALINGERGKVPQSLIDLLDALDLELVALPKGTQHGQ